jgi:putative NADPH-quinone reductase
MQALVVVAHPCDDSFTHAAAERAVAGLRAGGHAVEVVDLYALGFRVAMSPEERHAYHGETPLIDEHTREHARLVQWADCLVFVYPTWWSGLPAMLKGWLERVMVPGVAFVFDEHSGKVRPGLRQVRRLVGISSYGSPRRTVKLVNDNGRRTITRTLRMSCGFRARTTWFGLYGIDAASESDRRQFLDRVEARMARLS